MILPQQFSWYLNDQLIGLAISPYSACIQLAHSQTLQCTLHHGEHVLVLVNYRQPCLKIFRRWNNRFWALVGQILPYWATERLEHSIFHKLYAHSVLVNRRNWVWNRSSYYQPLKKWRPTSLESIALFQVRFSQTRRLRWDKKNLSYDAFEYAVQRKLTKLWLLKGVCTIWSATLHSNDHDSTDEKRRSLVGSTSQTGWICTKLQVRVHAGESKLRSRVTTMGRTKASLAIAKRQGWVPETRDHLPRCRNH